jgi:hypothetical protein
MPSFIRRGSEEQRQIWLLGQAAYWPDLARGLPAAEREKYNRANWHYTDGAWNRGEAQIQGNQYINTEVRPDIAGEPASAVRDMDDAHNVSTALDYNTALLATPDASPADRAVALCWVLHLMGDIHQPLHTGSLFSARLFRNGDRGGNQVSTDRGNLHSTWDSALREDGIQASIVAILGNRDILLAAANTDSHWDLWMSESREILLSQVYSEEMLNTINYSDRDGSTLEEFDLSTSYVEQMQEIARVRLGLAGIRLTQWFDRQLP